MKATVAVKLLEAMTPGRVYRTRELRTLSNNLTRDLNKLMKSRELVKAAPGLYYRPTMTTVGPLPASPHDLVRAFLGEEAFLMSSLDDYNALGLGLTQLYNETIVYNRKRHGAFELDGRRFSFRRPKVLPNTLSKEFLCVEALNNRHQLLEDTSQLEARLAKYSAVLDREQLLAAANCFGKVATRKFFEEICA